MSDFLSSIGALLIGVASFLGIYTPTSIIEPPAIVENLGGDSTLLIGGQTYYLSGSGISSSATSIILSSLTIPQTGQEIQDSDLSDTFYITIEPGNRTRQEFVSCTTVTQGAGTTATLSGCSRGLAPITPYTASTSLQFAHSGGSIVIFSNPPQVYNDAAFKNNDEAITGTWTFNSNLPTSSLLATGSTQFVTKTYVDSGILAGAATATESVTGISRLSTHTQNASSTPSTSNTPLVMQAQDASSTPIVGCDGSSTRGKDCVIVASSTGKIDHNYLPTALNVTWTGSTSFQGGLTSSGTTTIAASNVNTNPLIINGVNRSYPSTQGASGTSMFNDGSGNMREYLPTHTILYKSSASSTVAASATTTATTVTIPANTLGANGVLRISTILGGLTGNDRGFQFQFGNGSASTTFVQFGGALGVVKGNYINGTIANIGTTSNQILQSQAGSITADNANLTPSVRNYGAESNVDTTQTTYISFQARDDTSAATGYRSILVELIRTP